MAAIDLGGLPYSQIGQLQIRSRSGTIPSTIPRIGGWAVDPVAECAFVEDAGLSVPSTAVSIGALKYTPDGALYVTADTTTGPFTNIGGLKVRQDGAACIITKTPSVTLDPYIGGAAYDGATQAMVVGGAGFGFILPLVTTIVPTAGVGGATFTRATTATVEDWETVVRPVLSGEVRFQGARRVRNWIAGSSNDLNNGSWIKTAAGTGIAPVVTSNNDTAPDGTVTASRLQLSLAGGTTTADQSLVQQTTGISPTTNPKVLSIYLKLKSGTATVQIRSGSTVAAVIVTSSWQRFAIPAETTAAATFWVGLRGAQGTSDTADILVWGCQHEDVTGQSNANPAEYVSVGVLSAPFHGANVDGVKYFATQNGNTVVSNVVAEATGASISASIIKGYLAEGARTNLCLQSEDFATTWTNNGSTETVNALTAPDGNLTADKIVEDAGTSEHGMTQGIVVVSATVYTFSCFAKQGERPRIALYESSTTGAQATFDLAAGTVIGTGGGGTPSATIKAYPNGWYRCSLTLTAGASASQNFATRVLRVTDTSVTSYLGDGASGLYQWGAQLEAASFTSSYIPTTTVAVTRNADALTYVFAGNALAASGTAYAELGTEWNTASGNTIALVFGNTVGPLFVQSAVGSTTIRMFDGTTGVAKTGLTDMVTASRKRASSWGSTGMSITGDGAVVATAAFDGDLGSSAINIGQDNSATLQWFGTIKNVMISQSQLTDAQLAALTA